MSLRDWQEVHEESLVHYKVFDVVKARRRSPRTGVEIGFFLIRTPDWVNVVALTEQQELILVRQYRHGTRTFSLEIPGGLIDAHDADPAAAAARELREETGYAAQRWTALGAIDPNPAIISNRCWTFLAEGCLRVGEAALEEKEDIAVEEIPLARVPALLGGGEITHALVAVAFQKLDLHRAGALRCGDADDE